MNFESILILVLMVVASGFDALRDRWVDQKAYIGWWKWHVVKWISFFSPLALLTWFYFSLAGLGWVSIVAFLVTCVVSKVVWKILYLRIGW